jgi:hypothetical protein
MERLRTYFRKAAESCCGLVGRPPPHRAPGHPPPTPNPRPCGVNRRGGGRRQGEARRCTEGVGTNLTEVQSLGQTLGGGGGWGELTPPLPHPPPPPMVRPERTSAKALYTLAPLVSPPFSRTKEGAEEGGMAGD